MLREIEMEESSSSRRKSVSTMDVKMVEHDTEMHVEGWEFVSADAVAQEYVDMTASVVSSV